MTALAASASLVAQLIVVMAVSGGIASAAAGSLDPGFGSGGAVVSPPPSGFGAADATGVAVLPGGPIAASGGNAANSSSGSLQQFEVSLYSPSGGPAAAPWPVLPFSGAGGVSSQATAVTAGPGGNIVAAGWRSVPGATACATQDPVVEELTQAGSVVAGFPVLLPCPIGAGNAYFNSVALDPNGDIVAAGTEILAPGMTHQSFVAWIPANGSSGPAPTVRTAAGTSGALQSDGLSVIAPVTGNAYVAGATNGVASVAAFTKSGGLNGAFHGNGVQTFASTMSASGVAQGRTGLIYVDGMTASGGFLAQLDSSTGALINSFASGGIATSSVPLQAVAYEPLVNIVDVAGTSGSGSSSQMMLEQFDGSSATPNTAFGSGGIFNTGFGGPARAEAVAAQPDGKVVAAGGAPVPGGPAGDTSLGIIRVLGPELGPSPRLAAFRGSNGDLFSFGPQGWTDWGLGMASGTSPSMVSLPNGGYEISFQAYGGALWSVGTLGWINWGVGMAPGTSPSMISTPNGGYEVSFQAYGGALWSVGSLGWINWGVGMAPGTSPSMIATSNSGYEVSFQAYGGALWSVGTLGWINWGVGMAPGTSPSMIATPNAGYEVSFQANGGALWSVGTLGWINWGVGMAPGTSPSMISMPNAGYQVAFQANGGALWSVGTQGWVNWGVGMTSGASPDALSLPGGGYEIGFQAAGGAFWTIGTAFWANWRAAMAPGTSPSMI